MNMSATRCWRGSALFHQDLAPQQKIFLRKQVVFTLFATEVSRIVSRDETAHVLLKGQIFGAETKTHGVSLICKNSRLQGF
jgi:hypothetical protein